MLNYLLLFTFNNLWVIVLHDRVCVGLNRPAVKVTFTLLQQSGDDGFILDGVQRTGGVDHPTSNCQLLHAPHGNPQLQSSGHTHTQTPAGCFIRDCSRGCSLTHGGAGCCWSSISSTHLCSFSWSHRRCRAHSRAAIFEFERKFEN